MSHFKSVPTRLASLSFFAAMLLPGTPPAHAGLTFDFTLDPSITADFGATDAGLIQSDLNLIATTYGSLYTNNLTLNFIVTADTTPGALASSGATYFGDGSPLTYSTVRSALIAAASTTASISATSALPLTQPASASSPPNTAGGDGFMMTNAEAQALGLLASNPTLNDGTMNIGTNIGGGANWDFSGTSTPGPLDYSFVDAAEHEIAELMGRTTQLTNTDFPYNEPIDLFRCTKTGPGGAGVINMSAAATGVYFSTDGCATVAKDYNAPNADGADIQDWASSATPDPYDAYGTPGAFAALTTVDQEIMNTLGWTAATNSVSAPEPMSLAILGSGVLGLLGLRRKAARG
jgi:hypothetical protein